MGKVDYRWIPPGAELYKSVPELGIEVFAQLAPRVSAIFYSGKRNSKDWYYSFKDAAGLDARIAQSIADIQASKKYKAEAKAKRNVPNDVAVGDIFQCSWGYDQTNIDYYEVVKLVGAKMIEVREISRQSVADGDMQGECVPNPGRFIGPVMCKVVSVYCEGAAPSFRVASYASARRVDPVFKMDGVKIFPAARWTAYA